MDDCTALSIMPPAPLPALNQQLERLDAQARAAWALTHLPGAHVLSSSFGAQAAVSLHLLTRLMPNIPVILIDTGYLFAETYRFVDRLTERFRLNLRVYRPARSPAWQEARYGKLWEQGTAGLRRYNRINKVEPMRRALADLDAGTWFSGLRRVQATSRRATRYVEYRNGRYKVHPIADWSNRDVWVYLRRHRLPYHPLWEQGYVSIGDVHTTRPLEPGMREEETRFFGLQRECGLHSEL
ncbi:MAG TPA: phosphoadenylyl-sulfate reductase [Gammaproteobacteria bacterium]|nr:phosphoadenylyl-sulfate reductase [Gammaproteobacteria bacterium]